MSTPTRKNRTILVVDDSPIVVKALTAEFEAAGWEVGSAADGEEVFRKLTAYCPDVLLLDVVMPKINGAEVCRLVKGHPEWGKARVVIMTSGISARDADRYKKAGADDVLEKPLQPQQALLTVEKLFLVVASGSGAPV